MNQAVKDVPIPIDIEWFVDRLVTATEYGRFGPDENRLACNRRYSSRRCGRILESFFRSGDQVELSAQRQLLEVLDALAGDNDRDSFMTPSPNLKPKGKGSGVSGFGTRGDLCLIQIFR